MHSADGIVKKSQFYTMYRVWDMKVFNIQGSILAIQCHDQNSRRVSYPPRAVFAAHNNISTIVQKLCKNMCKKRHPWIQCLDFTLCTTYYTPYPLASVLILSLALVLGSVFRAVAGS